MPYRNRSDRLDGGCRISEELVSAKEKLKDTEKKITSDKKVLAELDSELKKETEKDKSSEIQLEGSQMSR